MGIERDIAAITLPRWGRVEPRPTGVVPFVVLDGEGRQVEPISGYLRDFLACGNRPSSTRSYAYALLRWWRFLLAVGVPWDRATPEEGRDYVLWLAQARKPIAQRRGKSAATAGRINPLTRKQYPGDRYQPRTIRNGNAVVRAFYEFWIELGAGPLLNPMPLRDPDHRPDPTPAALRYDPADLEVLFGTGQHR